MAIDLKSLTPTKISRNLKGKFVFMYGRPKIGKTSVATQFPKSLLVAFEPGYNILDNIFAQDILKWADFRQLVKQLEDPEIKEKFDTIIIDTTDIAWNYCERYICAKNPITDESGNSKIPDRIGEIPWGAGFDLCTKEYDEQFRKIAMLGYGMVFISHEQQKTIKDPKTNEEYLRYMPTLPDRPRLIVNRMVDIIGYLCQIEDPETGKKNRVIFTRESKHFEAGSRFPYLSPRIMLDYNSIVKAIYDAIEEQVQQNGAEITDEYINPYVSKGRPFEEVMLEARTLWGKHIAKDPKLSSVMLDIVERHFGRRIKLSETTAEQQDALENVINELKTL